MTNKIWVMLIFAVSAPALAHHSFSAEFDVRTPVTLKGVVTKIEWINPHSWIHLVVTEPGKPPQNWMVETGTPNTLIRKKIDRDAIKVGMEIVARGFQSKDRSCTPACKANGRSVTFPDGRKIFVGSSYTGAPKDGEDPAETKSGKSNPAPGKGDKQEHKH